LHDICFEVPDVTTTLEGIDEGDSSKVFIGGKSWRACFLNARPNSVLFELIESEISDGAIGDGESVEGLSESLGGGDER